MSQAGAKLEPGRRVTTNAPPNGASRTQQHEEMVMQVLVNSGKHVASSMTFKEDISSRVREKLQRYEDRLTRIEVHLSDENALKSGPQDKRCKVEARMKGRDPLTVSHDAEELHQAIEGAMNKLTNALDRNLGKDAKRWTH
jgi:ribosomal subunit interface protein